MHNNVCVCESHAAGNVTSITANQLSLRMQEYILSDTNRKPERFFHFPQTYTRSLSERVLKT